MSRSPEIFWRLRYFLWILATDPMRGGVESMIFNNSQILFHFTHKYYLPELVQVVPDVKFKMFKRVRSIDDTRLVEIGHLSDINNVKIDHTQIMLSGIKSVGYHKYHIQVLMENCCINIGNWWWRSLSLYKTDVEHSVCGVFYFEL